METVEVNDVSIPALGFGTARMTGRECRKAVQSALELGYRHIDTAQLYENEETVGEAITRSDIDRAELFVVTKVRRDYLAYDDVITSVQESLDRLGTTIDLLLIHAPSSSVPIAESIEAMNELQSAGSVSHIGVSNFSVDELEEAISASETPIITNQVAYHPFRGQGELLQSCLTNEVMLTAHTPLAKQDVLGDELLQAIGDRYGKNEAQVALRWLLQQELVCAIPKAASRTHQAENLDIFDFRLTPEEMVRIFSLHGGIDPRLRNRLGLTD